MTNINGDLYNATIDVINKAREKYGEDYANSEIVADRIKTLCKTIDEVAMDNYGMYSDVFVYEPSKDIGIELACNVISWVTGEEWMMEVGKHAKSISFSYKTDSIVIMNIRISTEQPYE